MRIKLSLSGWVEKLRYPLSHLTSPVDTSEARPGKIKCVVWIQMPQYRKFEDTGNLRTQEQIQLHQSKPFCLSSDRGCNKEKKGKQVKCDVFRKFRKWLLKREDGAVGCWQVGVGVQNSQILFGIDVALPPPVTIYCLYFLVFPESGSWYISHASSVLGSELPRLVYTFVLYALLYM